MDKIAPRSIVIHQTEGEPCATKHSHHVETWHQANALLTQLSCRLRNNDSVKVNFWVEFADGSTYAGQLGLTPSGVKRLDAHVRDFCLFMAGSRRPAHMSVADYARALATYPAQTLQRYRDYVTKYSLNAYETDALA